MSTPVTPTTTASGTTPQAMETPLRDGLPTGSGGPIGQDNSGTWSLLEQQQAFIAADPQLSPVPPATATQPATQAGS